MRFRIEQRFAAGRPEVQAALLDPEFLARLASLPKLGRPELLAQTRDGSTVRQRVRYAFVGELSPAVRAVVDPARLTWVEDSTTDVDEHRTRFTILPDHYANLLRCRGTFTLEASSPGCRRVAEGQIQVSVPLVGRRVEAAIVSGLDEHARLEAQALDDWLAGVG